MILFRRQEPDLPGRGEDEGRGLTVDEVMAILPETPRRIAGLTEGLAPTPAAWRPRPRCLVHQRRPGASPCLPRRPRRQHAPHPRRGPPGLEARESPRVDQEADYPAWEFAPALEAFTNQRTELLGVREPLPSDAWERTATEIGTRGETHQRSALFYGDWLADHERVHWEQIATIVAAVNRRLRDVVAAMTDEHLAIRPAPDRWPLWATVGHAACFSVCTGGLRMSPVSPVRRRRASRTPDTTARVTTTSSTSSAPPDLAEALDSTFGIVENCWIGGPCRCWRRNTRNPEWDGPSVPTRGGSFSGYSPTTCPISPSSTKRWEMQGCAKSTSGTDRVGGCC